MSSHEELLTDQRTTVIDLRSQLPGSITGIGPEPLRLTWRVAPAATGLEQRAFEIETSSTASFETLLASSGVVESNDQIAVPAPGDPMRSREIRFIRVRIATAELWTDWSPVLTVEAGLHHPTDWTARAITLPDDTGSDHQSPSPILRREFEVSGEVVKARLVCHLTRRSPGFHQRSAGIRRTTQSGLVHLPAPPLGRDL